MSMSYRPANPWRKVYDSPESANPWVNKPQAPLYLDCEPSGRCNLRCKFCVRNQMRRPAGLMSMACWERLVDEASRNGVTGLRMLRWGDPLLNPDAITMIRVAKASGLLIHLTTNALLVDANMAAALIESGLDSMIVSFQGLDKAGYEFWRGPHYEHFKKNVLCLMGMRSVREKGPYVQLNTTITSESEKDAALFVSEWERIVDRVDVGITRFGFLNEDVQNALEPFVEQTKGMMTHHHRCQEAMTKLSVDWDGTVTMCCLDYDRFMRLGNINEDNLFDLWHSPVRQATLELLNRKEQDRFALCRGCELNYHWRKDGDDA